jgi:ABC-type transport system substrate-binding protein
MRKRVLIAAIAAPIIAAAVVLTGTSFAATAQATTKTMYVTLYGWPDNSPPGDGTAFGSGHAGGNGTYAHPITFATDQHEIRPGTKVYYPYLKRYFVMQDECVQCDRDWKRKKWHIDLWIGGRNENRGKVIACEEALTRSGPVIINPPSNKPVSTTPLFKNGKCYHP